MTAHLDTFSLRTRCPTGFVDITDRVRDVVTRSGVSEGICVIQSPHTTAGITVNENADPAVQHDLELIMGRMVPREGGYRHAEGNSAAHMRSSLYGPSLAVIVTGGRLLLGTWQGVYFYEGDGPRTRSVHVRVLGE